MKFYYHFVKKFYQASLKHSLRSCFKLKPGKIFSLHGNRISSRFYTAHIENSYYPDCIFLRRRHSVIVFKNTVWFFNVKMIYVLYKYVNTKFCRSKVNRSKGAALFLVVNIVIVYKFVFTRITNNDKAIKSPELTIKCINW